MTEIVKSSKKEYYTKYKEEHKDKINTQIRERNNYRYNNDEEYRKKCIEYAKISVKKQREAKKN